MVLLRFWKPRRVSGGEEPSSNPAPGPHHSAREVLVAWAPYGLLVAFVLVWGMGGVKAAFNSTNVLIHWPGLHDRIAQVAPVVAKTTPYAAIYTFSWLSVSGTACMFAALLSTLVLGMSPRQTVRLLAATTRQLALPLITIAAVLALAFLMNYSGATVTLGLEFASTSVLFPFFSPLLGWLGVFLTGSDTSCNALFGNLQVVTAGRLGLNPVLMAAANSSGGVMGKMISVQSICVAVAATGMKTSDEARLFRFMLRHSIILASVIGLITLLYAYVIPQCVR